jgi:hypothetical protein
MAHQIAIFGHSCVWRHHGVRGCIQTGRKPVSATSDTGCPARMKAIVTRPVYDFANVFRPRPRGTLLAASLLLVGMAHAAPTVASTDRFTGTAYPRSGNQMLYREVHFLYQAQGQPRQLVLYQCPDGKPFARKVLQDSPASSAPNFEFVDGRSGFRAGVRGNNADRDLYLQKSSGSAERSQKMSLPAGTVIDAGFDTYVRSHWDALGHANATVPFLVASRWTVMNVRVGSSADAVEQGVPMRVMHMRLDTWYGFALPEIDLSYTLANHRLWRFEGPGSIRDSQGRDQIVRIEFPADAYQSDVPQAQVDAALTTPLVGRCEG